MAGPEFDKNQEIARNRIHNEPINHGVGLPQRIDRLKRDRNVESEVKGTKLEFSGGLSPKNELGPTLLCGPIRLANRSPSLLFGPFPA